MTAAIPEARCKPQLGGNKFLFSFSSSLELATGPDSFVLASETVPVVVGLLCWFASLGNTAPGCWFGFLGPTGVDLRSTTPLPCARNFPGASRLGRTFAGFEGRNPRSSDLLLS